MRCTRIGHSEREQTYSEGDKEVLSYGVAVTSIAPMMATGSKGSPYKSTDPDTALGPKNTPEAVLPEYCEKSLRRKRVAVDSREARPTDNVTRRRRVECVP